MLDISTLRHEKEKSYLLISSIVSGISWVILIWFAWLALIPLFFMSWLMGQYFKAWVFGNTVMVNKVQFKEVYEIVENAAKEMNVSTIPQVFVLSGQGALNAIAIRLLTGRYILLYGELIDLMLKRDAYDELRMIIGHELAHHALGHINIWRNIFLIPSQLIPFLGAAYRRSCELSADRAGLALIKNGEAARRALLSLSLGSETLASKVDLLEFESQEKHVPPIMGLIYEISASHPRMTRRIIELNNYEKSNSFQSLVPLQTLKEVAATKDDSATKS